MIHTKTLGNKVGPSIIYQNKALQILEFKLLSNNSVFPETTSSSTTTTTTTTTSTTTLESCKTEDNKRRLVYSLKMSEEFKDPAIKLFGKTISLPQNDFFSGDYDDQGSQTSSNAAVDRDNKNTSGEEEFATCENNEVESSNLDNEEKEEDAEDSEEKTLKKPDKILPCPRCNSMDTKFCYFNNYNVNQPRHFCKNCQRYWTAGGTMRNVPVGSGRRKNKSACLPQYRHAMAPTDHCLKPNGTVLTFGPDNPLCESMSSALDLAERSSSNSNSTEGFVPVQHAPPHFPTPQWPYQFPTAFYPAPQYWGCVAPGPWNMPWPYHLQPQPDLGYASPTLGKHDREGGNVQNDPERTILVPKTLRIDDPKEAAKSSIWSTLGIKNECINGERLFKAAFTAGKGKGNSEMDVDETSLVMQANPAAFSRSQCFHEST